jgi:hypothetical protein
MPLPSFDRNKRIGRVADVSEPTQTEARRIAEEARDRVRFEEEALELSTRSFVSRRHLVGSREEAEDLMQETYAGPSGAGARSRPGRTSAPGSCGSSRTSTSTAAAASARAAD